MTQNDKYLDELFREKLAGFEEMPPAHVWEGIQAQQQLAKRNKLFFVLKITGIAAVILVAFLLGWQINRQPEMLIPSAPVVIMPGQQEVIKDNRKKPSMQISEVEKQKELTSANSNSADIFRNQTNETFGDLRAINSVEGDQLLNKQTKQPDNYSFLTAVKFLAFSLKTDAETLVQMQERKNEQAQSLTVDDLETIEHNKGLLAMAEKQKQDNPWQIAAMLVPNLTVSQANYKSSYASNMSVPGAAENLNMGAGISIEYKTNKRWSFQSGVYYSQLDQSSSNQSSSETKNYYAADNAGGYFNTPVEVKSDQLYLNASAGVIEIDNLPSNVRVGNNLESMSQNNGILLTEGEFQQNFEYIEIPFIVRYQLIDAIFKVNLLGGFSTNWLVGNDTYLQSTMGRNRIGETRDMNSVSYSTTLGLGFGYGISDKISIRIEPQLKYFMGSLNSNSSLQFKPYTIGMYTGLSYRF